jgi:hypothetical protein
LKNAPPASRALFFTSSVYLSLPKGINAKRSKTGTAELFDGLIKKQEKQAEEIFYSLSENI